MMVSEHMKKIMIFLSFIFFCFTFIFFDCENVKAADENCSYGVMCIYQLPEIYVDAGNSHHATDGSYGIYLQCNDPNKNFYQCMLDGHFVSTGYGAIHDTTHYQEIKSDNYDEIFHNADGNMGYFRTNSNNFKCPTLVYKGVEVKPHRSEVHTKIYYNKSQGNDNVTYHSAEKKSSECIPQGQNVNYDEFVDKVQTRSTATLYENATPDYYDDNGDIGDLSIIDAIFDWGSNSDDSKKYSSEGVDPCALINGEIQEILHDAFLFISVGGIIILVVMTSISLVKVITASEDDALRNFLKGLWKRIICLIILLVLPVLVTFIIQLVNNVAPSLGINSDNPLCNVTE